MTAAAERWIAELGDRTRRSAARHQLLALGTQAVDSLLAAADAPGEPERLHTIAWLLVALADPRADQLFKGWLRSDDEHLRAAGASGLARLQSPYALDALVATIDDAADPLHADVTPSATGLGVMGRAAAAAVLNLLESRSEMTRLRAQHALEAIASSETRGAWSELWARNGGYRWDAPEAQRAASLLRWRRWLALL